MNIKNYILSLHQRGILDRFKDQDRNRCIVQNCTIEYNEKKYRINIKYSENLDITVNVRCTGLNLDTTFQITAGLLMYDWSIIVNRIASKIIRIHFYHLNGLKKEVFEKRIQKIGNTKKVYDNEDHKWNAKHKAQDIYEYRIMHLEKKYLRKKIFAVLISMSYDKKNLPRPTVVNILKKQKYTIKNVVNGVHIDTLQYLHLLPIEAMEFFVKCLKPGYMFMELGDLLRYVFEPKTFSRDERRFINLVNTGDRMAGLTDMPKAYFLEKITRASSRSEFTFRLRLWLKEPHYTQTLQDMWIINPSTVRKLQKMVKKHFNLPNASMHYPVWNAFFTYLNDSRWHTFHSPIYSNAREEFDASIYQKISPATVFELCIEHHNKMLHDNRLRGIGVESPTFPLPAQLKHLEPLKIKSTTEMINLGQKYNHCLGVYATKSTQYGNYFFHENKAVAEVRVSPSDHTASVLQCWSPNNKHTEMSVALKKKLEATFINFVFNQDERQVIEDEYKAALIKIHEESAAEVLPLRYDFSHHSRFTDVQLVNNCR